MGLFQSALVIILTSIFFHPALSQSNAITLGSRANGMGNAAVALKDDFAPFNNVGASSDFEDIILITAFTSKYSFAPFQHFGAGLVYPTQPGVFSFTLSKFGSTLYNEQHVGLGFSNSFGLTSLGIKLNYVQFSIWELGTKGIPTIELGGTMEIFPSLSFGAHIYNLTQAKLLHEEEDELFVPVILKVGINYEAAEALLIGLGIEKNLERDVRFMGGLEYQFLEKFYLRSGLSSAPFQQHYGLGFSPYNFSFDYSLENHRLLGLSHHISLTYKFIRKVPN